MRLRILLLILLLGAGPLSAAQIEGIVFYESLRWRETPLELNAVALFRYRILFKVYVAGLYLGEQAGPERVLDDVPRRLEIHYFYAFSAEDFRRATTRGIARNASPDVIERIQPQIEQFNALYRPVDEGDRYALTYAPGVGTELALNGEPLGLVPGAEFSAALFSIWLGREPFDADLKRDLLTP